MENPFSPGDPVCCVPTPSIDVACIHVHMASPDGTCRIIGPEFQDVDIAIAAGRTIVSCEELVSNEEIRRHPERNTLAGLCVDAVVPLPYGAHPSQCFGCYDYDGECFIEYDEVSRSGEGFRKFLDAMLTECPDHAAYLDRMGAGRLLGLRVDGEFGYVVGLKRK